MEPGEVTRAVTSIQTVLPLLWPSWAFCILVSTHSTRPGPDLGHPCGSMGISGECLAHGPSIGLVSPAWCGENEEVWAVPGG